MSTWSDTKIVSYIRNNKLVIQNINLKKTKYWKPNTPSVGENRIEQWLSKNKILYLKQARFDTCFNPKTGQILPFDFFLLIQGKIIEYSGTQHEEYTPLFHKTKKQFNEQVYRDKIKKKWAKDKNVEFIEIFYKDWDNIEQILEDKILKK